MDLLPKLVAQTAQFDLQLLGQARELSDLDDRENRPPVLAENMAGRCEANRPGRTHPGDSSLTPATVCRSRKRSSCLGLSAYTWKPRSTKDSTRAPRGVSMATATDSGRPSTIFSNSSKKARSESPSMLHLALRNHIALGVQDVDLMPFGGPVDASQVPSIPCSAKLSFREAGTSMALIAPVLALLARLPTGCAPWFSPPGHVSALGALGAGGGWCSRRGDPGGRPGGRAIPLPPRAARGRAGGGGVDIPSPDRPRAGGGREGGARVRRMCRAPGLRRWPSVLLHRTSISTIPSTRAPPPQPPPPADGIPRTVGEEPLPSSPAPSRSSAAAAW